VIVLGLDGARGGFSAAVARDGDMLAAVDLPGQVALEQGLAAVSAAMRQAGVAPTRLDRIGVGIGPGSFTGVRIAISYAKSLAQGWRLPLVGVNSFDAAEAGMSMQTPLLNVVPGRKGVISARLREKTGERRASGYVGDVLDELVPDCENLVILGDAKDVCEGLAERGMNVMSFGPVVQPSALAVAFVASTREPARSLHEVRADYGELPAAKVPKHL
jgi:tRNA threonylcarbamoyladenosine biosynthesis protein TsaB